MGQHVVDLAHMEAIDQGGLLPALDFLTDANSTSAYDRADTMISIGENGLALVGDTARDRIDAWSDDVVSDVGARRMYSLGCGAVIIAANSIHRSYNARLFDELMGSSGVTGPDNLGHG